MPKLIIRSENTSLFVSAGTYPTVRINDKEISKLISSGFSESGIDIQKDTTLRARVRIEIEPIADIFDVYAEDDFGDRISLPKNEEFKEEE